MAERRINGELIVDNNYDEAPNWFGRIMVGGMALVGIAQLSTKIGGPFGKAINISINQQANAAMAKLMEADGTLDFNTAGSFQHKIIMDDGEIFKPGEIFSGDEMDGIFRSHFEMDATSVSLVNNLERLEFNIENTISSAAKGDPLYKQLSILNGYNLNQTFGSTHIKGLATITTAVKLDALRQYGTSMQKSGDQLDMDIYDVNIENLNAGDIVMIDNNHNNMVRDNKKYAELYSNKLDKMQKQVSANAIKSNPLEPLSNSMVLVPSSQGNVNAMLVEMTNDLGMHNLKNKQIELYATNYSSKDSKAVINRNLKSTVISKEIVDNPYFRKYSSALSAYANDLALLQDKSNGAITNIAINYKDIDGANYFEIRVSRDFSNNMPEADVVQIISIVDNEGIVPKAGGTAKTKAADLITIEKQHGVVNQTKSANTTLRQIHAARNTLRTNIAKVDLLQGGIENLQDLQKLFNRSTSQIEKGLSLLEGDGRDIFKQNQVRMNLDQEFRQINNQHSQSATLAAMKSGKSSLLNMNALSRTNGMTITIDLEALNVNGKVSPAMMAASADTGLWSASVQLSDGRGGNYSPKEWSSDHILAEQNFIKYGLVKSDGSIDRVAIRKHIQTAEGAGLNEYAGYLRESLQVKELELDYSVEKFITTVQGKTKAGNQIHSSEQMANEVIAEIYEGMKVAEQKFPGRPVNLVFANGTQFDMKLLETLSNGEMNKLKGKKGVNIIDVTDMSRSLNMGKFDKSGNKLSRIATEAVLKVIPSLATDKQFDLEGDKNQVEYSLKLLSDPKRNKGILTIGKGDKSIYSLLEQAVGGDVQFHTSAAADTLLTQIIVRATMKFDMHNKRGMADDMDYINNFRGNIQGSMFNKTANDAFQMMGLTYLDGVMLTGAGLSKGQLAGGAGALINPGNINPFWSENPWARDLHQLERGAFTMRKNSSPYHRSRTAITSNITEQMINTPYKTAGMDANIFTNRNVFKTAYTVGSYGNQEGFSAVSRRVHDEVKIVIPKRLKMDMANINFNEPGLHADVWNFYTGALTKAANQIEVNKNMGAEDVRKFIKDEFARSVAGHTNKLQIDPDNPAHQRFLIGSDDYSLSQSTIGNIVGIDLDVNTATNKVSNLLLQIHETASIGENSVLNFGGGSKAIAQVFDLNEAVMDAGHKALGFTKSSMPEMFTSLDAIDKGYIGAVKDIAVKKVMYQANEILAPGATNAKGRLYSSHERENAKKVMERLAAKMKELGGAKIAETDGWFQLKFDDKLKGMNSDVILAGAQNLSLTSIMETGAALGHDMVWNSNQMMNYYGLFGSHGNDMQRGRENLHRAMLGHVEGVKGSPEAKIAEMVKLMRDGGKSDGANLNSLLDPMSVIDQKLETGNYYKKYQIRSAYDLFSKDKATISEVINDMQIPKFFESVIDAKASMHDNAYRTAFGYYGTGEVAIGATGKNTFELNADIKLRHGYDDNLLTSPYVSKSFKDVIKNSQTSKSNSLVADTSATVNKMLDIYQNNSLTELMQYDLKIEDIRALVTKDQTRKDIIKRIKILSSQSKRGDDRELIALKAQLEVQKRDGMKMDAQIKETKINAHLNERMQVLDDAYDNTKYVSNATVQNMLNLGGNNSVGLIQLKNETGGFMKKGQAFQINLERYASSVHDVAAAGNPLDTKAMINLITRLKERQASDKNFDSKNAMLDMHVAKNGEHIVTMNALPVPLFNEWNNATSRMNTPLGEGFTQLSEGANLQQKFFDAVLLFQEQIKSQPTRIEGHAQKLFVTWAKMQSDAISLDKDSAWNLGTQTSTMKGIRAHYDVAENVVTHAKTMLYDIEKHNGMSAKYSKLHEQFKNMSEQEQLNFKKHLGMVANAGDATTFIAASSAFGGEQQFNMGEGQTISYNKMLNSKDTDLAQKAKDIQNGLATIPGGMTRFPVEPNAQLGVLQLNILGLQKNFMDIAGINSSRIYLSSIVGALQKADTDGDMTNIVMQGYNSIKHYNDSNQQAQLAQKRMFESYDVTMMIAKANAKGSVIGIEQSNSGQTIYKVAQLNMTGGGMTEKRMTAEDYFATFENSTVAQNLKQISDSSFMHLDNSKPLAQAIESHIQTHAVGVYSSSSIGLITNTMRERVRDLSLIKSIAPGANVAWNDATNSIESAFGEMTQLSVKLGKHATAESAKKLSDIALFMSNPIGKDMDMAAAAKDQFLSFYTKDTSKTAQMSNLWESLMIGFRSIDQLKQDNPDFARYRELETSIQLGRKGINKDGVSKVNMMNIAEYQSYNNKAFAHIEKRISDRGNEMLQASINAMSAQAEGSLDLDLLRHSDAFMDGATQKYASRKLSDLGSHGVLKHGGRFAAIGGIALLAANLFSPMVGTGVDAVAGNNNFINSDLELGRHQALDQVDASFSKEAFAYMNDRNTNTKELEGNIINNMIQTQAQNSLFGQQPHKFNQKVDVTRLNRMGYIGPFGSSEYSRGL